jgi:hypothetical protein
MTLEPHSAGRSSRTQPRGDSQVAEPTRHLRMMGRGRHTPINDCNGAQCATTGIGREPTVRPATQFDPERSSSVTNTGRSAN